MTAQSSSSFFGSPAALREMLAGHELAARASRQTAAILTPEEAFDAAQDLWSLCPERLVIYKIAAWRPQDQHDVELASLRTLIHGAVAHPEHGMVRERLPA